MAPPTFYAKTREDWRQWLFEHHASASEISLVYFKKSTGKPSVSYPESVKEAICFGWIDGVKKRLDGERYTHRFSPRRPKSKWSPLNLRYAAEMIAAGRMTPAGLAAYDARQSYSDETLARVAEAEVALDPEIERALRAHPTAWTHFTNLAPGYRKLYAGWLMGAKRPETRAKRIAEALVLLARGEKLGMR